METNHFVGKVAQKAIIEKGGKFLLARNAFDKSIGVWDLPGGRLHEDEQPMDGIRREIKEELGIDLDVVKLVYIDQHRKSVNNELTMLVAYAATMRNPAQEVVLDPTEVEETVWVTPAELDTYKTFDNIERALKTYFGVK